jgi:hypothetical protein
VTRLPEGFSHFVASIAAPVASDWSDLAGWDLHPLESAALSRRTLEADIIQAIGCHRNTCGWNDGRDIRSSVMSNAILMHIVLQTKACPIWAALGGGKLKMD